MNPEERDWLDWLKRVWDGVMTQRRAAEKMGITHRWVRTLLARVGKEGDEVVVHGLRGHPSNRRIDEVTQTKAVKLLKQPEWHDFGPTFASEQLAKRHKIQVSKETTRGWMNPHPVAELEGLLDAEGAELNPEQGAAVRNPLSYSISLMTGGAGSVTSIADRLELRVVLAAPTGKAAKRLEQVVGGQRQQLAPVLQLTLAEDTYSVVEIAETDQILTVAAQALPDGVAQFVLPEQCLRTTGTIRD